jgi:hypothetical protein
MDRAPDYVAGSTNLSAQLWRAERRKRYGGIPVRSVGALCVYDDAHNAVTRRTITSNSARPQLFIHRSVKSGSARANKPNLLHAGAAPALNGAGLSRRSEYAKTDISAHATRFSFPCRQKPRSDRAFFGNARVVIEKRRSSVEACADAGNQNFAIDSTPPGRTRAGRNPVQG